MTILNRAELDSQIQADLLNFLPTNGNNDITAEDVRNCLTSITADQNDSLQAYAGSISGDVVEDIEIFNGEVNAVQLTTFNSNDTTENDIFLPSFTNNQIRVKEPAVYFVSVLFNGMWGGTEDLSLGIYVNGVPNTSTPIVISDEGRGIADPLTVAATRLPFVINSAQISAGAGSAAVEIYAWSTTGEFNLDQSSISLGMSYYPLTIRTVG